MIFESAGKRERKKKAVNPCFELFNDEVEPKQPTNQNTAISAIPRLPCSLP